MPSAEREDRTPAEAGRYLAGMKNNIIIKNCGTEWILLWILGSIFFASGILFSEILYYVCMYFYALAILAFIYGRLKFAVMDDSSILIFVGFLFKRSSIRIAWESIKRLNIRYIKKEWRTRDKGASDGAGPPFTIFSFDDDEVIEIELENELSYKDIKKIHATNRFMLKDRIVINGNGKIIQLKEVPDISLKNLCEAAESIKTGNFDFNSQNLFKVNNYIRAYEILLFAMPLIIFLFLKDNLRL